MGPDAALPKGGEPPGRPAAGTSRSDPAHRTRGRGISRISTLPPKEGLACNTFALVIPSTASAQINTFQIGSPAQLGPEGASLNVPVTINCDPGFEGNVDVDIRQAQGKRLIDGSGSAGVTCTGLDQTLIVVVRSGSGIRFKQGSAAASGFLDVFNPSTGQFSGASVDPQAIRIVK